MVRLVKNNTMRALQVGPVRQVDIVQDRDHDLERVGGFVGSRSKQLILVFDDIGKLYENKDEHTQDKDGYEQFHE